jgi:hypothetical protein
VSILLVISTLVRNIYNTKLYFSEAVLDKFSSSVKNELTNFTKLAVKHAPGKQRKQNAAAVVAQEDDPR